MTEARIAGPKRKILLLAALAALVWTAFICASLVYHYIDSRTNIIQLAHESASESIQKDLLYRFWAAGHGGVYVPVTEATPPNPYLSAIKERDITTPSGKKLTLMNPAYMTRQVHELGKLRFGNRAHITSDKPLNPQNHPDEWEARALGELKKGAREFGEVVTLDGRSYFRLMVPLITEEACLKCHAVQGYVLGDIRGGISSAVPMRDYNAVVQENLQSEGVYFAGVWLLGILVVAGSVPFVKRRIDERDRATAALTESEDRYRSLFEQSRDAIFIVEAAGTSAGRIVSVNNAALSMYGYTEPEFLALPVQSLVPDSQAGELSAIMRQVDTDGRVRQDALHRRKDGSEFVLEVTATRILAGGKPYCMFVGRDSSDLKQAEQQRKELEEQLIQAQKIESLGRLAGGVAHDINNMLMPIMGYAQILSDALPEGDSRKQEAIAILRSAERVRDIARQLLAFARRQTLDMRPLDVNGVLSGFEKMLRRAIRENVVIETRYAASLPPIMGDPGQIEQVILNLAVNAQDAMPNGGKLLIETGQTVLNDKFVQDHQGARAGEHVTVTVADTGMGMERDVQSRIFEPFFTTKERGRGTGLGLAMAYGIIKQHGGYVDVASELGRGTTFRLFIPSTRQAPAPAVQARDAVPKPHGRETVLVLEDQQEVLGVVTAMLAEYGYRVLSASTPQKALSLPAETGEQIDLLITDVIMPGMNGTEVYQRLRAVRPGLKVLYMSGYPDDVISSHGVLRPGIHFIQKPFVPALLLQKVRDALGPEAQGAAQDAVNSSPGNA